MIGEPGNRHDDDGEHKTIYPVQQAAMTWDQVTGVLNAEPPL